MGTLRKTTAVFIAELQAKHGTTYNYSQTEYKGIKSLITVLCRQHGSFSILADNHLQGKGCQLCSKENAKALRIDTVESFILKANLKHGQRFDYSQVVYKGTADKVVVVCPQHGAFKVAPNNHLQGQGCKKCADDGLRKSKDNFLHEARTVHGYKYDYSQVLYQQSSVKVTIICSQHGSFQQTPGIHLRGHGCPKCTNDARRSCWSAKQWAEIQAGRLALLYVVRLSSESEIFYKAGITFQGLENRFRTTRAYQVEPLAVFASEDAFVIHQAEALVKKSLKHLRYKPATRFCGHTECFTDPAPILALLDSRPDIKRQE